MHHTFFTRLGFLVGFLVLTWTLCGGVSAADITPLPVDAATTAQLEKLACRDRHTVGVEHIDGRVYGKNAGATAVAEVRCASHGVYMGNPMHRIVQCSRAQGAWTCQGDWNEITVVAGTDRIPVRIEGDIPSGVAHQTIHKLATSGSFQGYPLREALVAPCYLHKGEAQEFMDVKCEGWHIVVSMWCPQSDCPRVFSINKLGS